MRRIWNRWLLIGILLLSLPAAGGCREKALPDPIAEQAKNGPQADVLMSGTIHVMTNRVDLIENGTLEKYAKRFELKYPGAKVEFEGITDYTNDVMARLSTRDIGDVLLLPVSIANKDLPSYFEPLEASMFEHVRFPDFKAYNGVRYGIATGSSTIGIVYNKKAFAKAGINGVPQTLDAFYEACAKLKAAGTIPLYMNYGAKWPLQQWGENMVNYMTGSADALNNMVNEDEPFQLDNPWGQAVGIAKTLINRGYVEDHLFSNSWEISKSKIASGEAAMYFLGNWAIQQVIDAGADPKDIGLFPFPYDNNTQHYSPLTPDWFIGVSKFSTHKELARAWIEFYVKESGYVNDSGFLPVDNTQKTTLPQFQEFLSYKPELVENKQQTDEFIELANKAGISFWSGGYIQELIASPDLGKAFEELNRRWKQARRISKI
ncbi:extracellular solute-binding protein [Paenibacillus sp. HJL G12]|uniref:Extracellular solute-binding protein n=1 Tax=Paenibacillus dendrobii TaxID=2691084 RepID=A0A7X3IM38_9BACL|nr:ABC transporter substrate-binding protein [Paenibacillus dendrobii]MWV46469.1 extracellular solute-binding protein [Paenibacillus dendrobii]